MEKHGALDPTAIAPTRRSGCFKLDYKYPELIHMYFTQAIYRLNIMFRHMPVTRDTSVLTSDYYC